MQPLQQLALIVCLGVGAEWLAWRLRFPSILLFLLVGFVAGPITGILEPDRVFGTALLPLVAISVALILLEGGLGLELRQLRGTGGAVRRLILIGIPITWALTTAAAWLLLHMELRLALLLGAILVVTGPTVITPLMAHIRPRGTVGSIARWEGIVNDAIGAILAVLVFPIAVRASADGAFTTAVLGALKGLLAVPIGAAAALLLVQVMRRYWVPDHLHSPVTLAVGVGVFLLGNLVQHESGLLAVTVMAMLLANQKAVPVESIVEFKENLRVLLLSTLFIILSARLPSEYLLSFDPALLAFLAALIFVVRPVMVFFSTIGTTLDWREKVFLAWMAPRGIVAAAVASVFALELQAVGYPEPERLVSTIFLVVVGTVVVYGLTAAPLARALGLAGDEARGVLLVGAHEWAREFATALRGCGVDVRLADSNLWNVRQARMQGLDAVQDNVLAESFLQTPALDGVGKALFLTSNDEVNALGALHLTQCLERASIFQLAPHGARGSERMERAERTAPGERAPRAERDESHAAIPRHIQGRTLFAPEMTFLELQLRTRNGATVKRTPLTPQFDYAAFRARCARDGIEAIPLFAVDGEHDVTVFTADNDPEPEPGQVLITLQQKLAVPAVASVTAEAGAPPAADADV